MVLSQGQIQAQTFREINVAGPKIPVTFRLRTKNGLTDRGRFVQP